MPSSLRRQYTAPLPIVANPSLLDTSQLDEWAPQWDRLVDAAPLPSPFLRSWWLTGTGGTGRHFLLVVDRSELLGGLALEQPHRTSRVRVMGDGPLCPDHVDLLAAPGHEPAVVALIGDWFRRPGGRIVDLRGIREGSALAETLPGTVRSEPMAAAPFALLPESAEDFRAGLPSQFPAEPPQGDPPTDRCRAELPDRQRPGGPRQSPHPAGPSRVAMGGPLTVPSPIRPISRRLHRWRRCR